MPAFENFKLSDFATEIRYLNLYLKQLYKHALEILQFIVSQKLIVATNQNDILHRAISKGQYQVSSVIELSQSPLAS